MRSSGAVIRKEREKGDQGFCRAGMPLQCLPGQREYVVLGCSVEQVVTGRYKEALSASLATLQGEELLMPSLLLKQTFEENVHQSIKDSGSAVRERNCQLGW